MQGWRTIRGVCRLTGAVMMLGMSGAIAAQTTPAPAPEPTPQQQRQQFLDFAKTHYAKHEYRLAMRDGTKLYTVVYTPIAGQFQDVGPFPFLMSRTPYSCGNYDNAVVEPHVTQNMGLLRSGYILVAWGFWASAIRGSTQRRALWMGIRQSKRQARRRR